MKRLGFIAIFLILFVFGSITYAENTNKNILVLHSYDIDYGWTTDIDMGIDSIIKENENVIVEREYMDAKRNNSYKYYNQLYKLYKVKFRSNQFDTIIASDNDALDFLLKYKEDLFPNTPVVACGVNELYTSISNKEGMFIGISEHIDFEETLKTMLNLHKNTNKIVIFNDSSPTGIINRQLINSVMYSTKISQIVNFHNDLSIEEIEEITISLNQNDIIFFIDSVINDNNGNVIPMSKAIERISAECNTPIYSAWDFTLGHGIVGGKLVSGFNQGQKAAEITKQILNGKSPSQITVAIESPNEYMFDFNQLKRFNINQSDLPKDSKIINIPSNTYMFAKDFIRSIVTAVIFILVLIIIILLYNISMRREAEDKLNEKYLQLSSLINTIPDFVILKDGKGRWIQVNNSCLNVFGLRDTNYKGKTDFDLAKENVFLKSVSHTCEKTDELAWIKGKIVKQEEVIPSQNGHDRYYDVIKAPVYNKNGSRKGLVVVGRDITQNKNAQKKLKKNEESYRRLINLIPDAIIIHDGIKITLANPAAVKILGAQSTKDIIDKPLNDLVHPDYKQIINNRINYQRQSMEKVGFCEEKYFTLDGKIINVEVAAVPFKNDGKCYNLVVARDITDKKIAEKLKEKIQKEETKRKEALQYENLRTEFFSNISHELRTPLNLILGCIQLIELNDKCNNKNEENIHKRIKIIKQNCYRLLKLVNNLIDITKMDSGYLSLNLNNYNIVSVVEDITLSIIEYTKQKGISLIFDTNIEEKIIACDVDKIERIILNLLSNAIKFTDAGGSIKVIVKDMNEKVRIIVKDTGIGIPKDKISQIFDRFRQVDKSFTRNHEGSGIGLSLVKSLVNMHDGKIYVNSEEGRGSEFIIDIPSKIIEGNQTEVKTDNLSKNYVERINIEFSDIYNN